MKPYAILFGIVCISTVGAFVAFLHRLDLLLYISVGALFYTGLWALWRASTLEKESLSRFRDTEKTARNLRRFS